MSHRSLKKAEALTPPGPIGIVAPASAPLNPSDLSQGLAELEKRGFQLVRKRNTLSPVGYLAGSDAARTDEFNDFLRSDNVQALLCVRGGYGVLRMLDSVDFEAAAKHPKLLIGYSDITALQLALYKRAGWASISGPMVAVEWNNPHPACIEQFLSLAAGRVHWLLEGQDRGGDRGRNRSQGQAQSRNWKPNVEVLTTGHAVGRLIGGNLTLITRLIGTGYLPDLSGAILFLEEVGEPPYRIDGLLAHLRLAGILDRVAGVILGGFTNAEPEPDRPTLSLMDIFEHYFGDLGIPVVHNFPYGHFPEKVALPVGVSARLSATGHNVSVELLEQVVTV